jgi:hypothetical protein
MALEGLITKPSSGIATYKMHSLVTLYIPDYQPLNPCLQNNLIAGLEGLKDGSRTAILCDDGNEKEMPFRASFVKA